MAKTDVDRRNSLGRRAINFPVTTNQEFSIRPEPCMSCVKSGLHDVCTHIAQLVPIGEHPEQRVNVDERLDIPEANRIQQAIYDWGAHLQPNPRDAREGFANGNQSDSSKRYQVIAASGNVVTVKGQNPRYVTVEVVSINGGFIPLVTPRLNRTDVALSLPVGAYVDILPPSVLAQKLRPRITKVVESNSSADDNVTFDLHLTNSVDNIMEPYDLAFPPSNGRYFVEVNWPFVPDEYLNLQETKTAHWNKISKRFFNPVVQPLLDAQGNQTRILMPGMADWSWTAELVTPNGNRETVINPIVTTTEVTPGSWETTIDLTGYALGTTYSYIEITYYAEATTCNGTRSVIFQSRCSNAQKEKTGSYTHAGDHVCVAAADSSELANFSETCWKPSCSRFCLDGFQEENKADGPDKPTTAAVFAGFYNRPHLMRVVPGFDQPIVLEKQSRSGPSIQGLAGAFYDRASGFAGVDFREPYHDPALGRRLEYAGTGGDRQTVVYGAWFEEPYDLSSTGGPTYEYTAGGTPDEGWLSDEIGTAWDNGKDPYDNNIVNDEYPPGGAASVNVYQGAMTGEAWRNAASYQSQHEQTVVALDVTETVQSVVDEVGDLIP